MEARRDPVFIVGYGRSGTEMIRFMLNEHPGVAITPEYRKFALYDPDLMADTIQGSGFVPEGIEDRAALRKAVRAWIERAPADALAAYGQAWAEKNGKMAARWGDKYTANWQFVETLARWYPGSQFVHLVRDPRDVVSSVIQHFPRSIVVPRTLVPPHINLAWRWRKSLRRVIAAGERLGAARYLRLRYEDNVARPGETARTLCRFLGLDFREAMLTAHRGIRKGRSHAPSKSHTELARPISTRRIGRHAANLSPAQAAEIEAVCGDEMRAMGYAPSSSSPPAVRKAGISILTACFELGWSGVRTARRLRGRL